jgi:hypothetical protein
VSARSALLNTRDHPDSYRPIRYESVVSAPEQTMREVCDFIGEPFAPEMLSLQGAPEFSARGSNSSYGERAPGAITTTSVGRFRDVLSPRQVAFVQRLAADLMERCGYEPDPVPLPVIGWARFVVATVPVETGRMLAWRAREAVRDRTGRPVPAYRLVEGARS